MMVELRWISGGFCFGRFLEALCADGRGIVAIDGKTLRRSFDRATTRSPLHVVTAFDAKAQLVLGQAAFGEGFAQDVRAHWTIENGLRWVLDMAFDKDRARARKDHAAENLAIIRKLALKVLKTARPTSRFDANEIDPDGPTNS